MARSTNPIITLRCGWCIPLAALQLAWRLEDQGYTFKLDGPRLLVAPYERLTPDDLTALRAWKADICSLLRHFEDVNHEDALSPPYREVCCVQ
jgi:hypothetical protein